MHVGEGALNHRMIGGDLSIVVSASENLSLASVQTRKELAAHETGRAYKWRAVQDLISCGCRLQWVVFMGQYRCAAGAIISLGKGD